MELRPYKTDLSFARRSACYLAGCGCTRGEIVSALVEQLDLRPEVATQIVAAIAFADAVAA